MSMENDKDLKIEVDTELEENYNVGFEEGKVKSSKQNYESGYKDGISVRGIVFYINNSMD